MPIERGDLVLPEIALGLASSMNIDGRALIGLGSVKLTDPSQTANGYI